MKRNIFDAALMLRDPAAAAINATTAETGILMKELGTLGGADLGLNGKTSSLAFMAIINVSAHDRTTGDETATFTIEACTSAAGAGAVTVGTTAALTAVGKVEIPLSLESIREKLSTATYLRVKATLAGTTPITSYGCYLAPCC
jgi:hypothetical protein